MFPRLADRIGKCRGTAGIRAAHHISFVKPGPHRIQLDLYAVRLIRRALRRFRCGQFEGEHLTGRHRARADYLFMAASGQKKAYVSGQEECSPRLTVAPYQIARGRLQNDIGTRIGAAEPVIGDETDAAVQLRAVQHHGNGLPGRYAHHLGVAVLRAVE